MIVLCLTVKRPDTLPFVASTCNNRVSHGNSYHLSTLHCYDAPQPLFRSLSLSRVSAVLSVWSLLTAVLFLVASFHVQVHSGAVGFPSLPSSDRQGPQKSASCSSYKLKEKTKIIINVLIILIMNCLQPPVLLYRSNNIDWDHQNFCVMKTGHHISLQWHDNTIFVFQYRKDIDASSQLWWWRNFWPVYM